MEKPMLSKAGNFGIWVIALVYILNTVLPYVSDASKSDKSEGYSVTDIMETLQAHNLIEFTQTEAIKTATMTVTGHDEQQAIREKAQTEAIQVVAANMSDLTESIREMKAELEDLHEFGKRMERKVELQEIKGP